MSVGNGLSILVPTYNRCVKLKRILDQLFDILSRNCLDIKIEILVSDNCSTDETTKVIAQFAGHPNAGRFNFVSFSQQTNLEMDGNMAFLIEKSTMPFVWILSDDDILVEPGLVAVLVSLKSFLRNVLISNFEQPPYSEKNKMFEMRQEIGDLEEGLSKLILFPKVTAYIFRRVDFEKYRLVLKLMLGTNFLWLGYVIISFLENPILQTNSLFIAKADEDYAMLRYSPRSFFKVYDILNITTRLFSAGVVFNNIAKKNRFYDFNPIFHCVSGLIWHYRGKLKFESNVLSKEHEFVRSYLAFTANIIFRIVVLFVFRIQHAVLGWGRKLFLGRSM